MAYGVIWSALTKLPGPRAFRTIIVAAVVVVTAPFFAAIIIAMRQVVGVSSASGLLRGSLGGWLQSDEVDLVFESKWRLGWRRVGARFDTIDRSARIPIHNARVYARKPDSCEPCRCVCPLLVYSISLDVTIHVRSKLILTGQQQTSWRLELHGDDLSSTYRTAIRCFGTLSPRSSATEGYLDSRCRETLSRHHRCWS